MNNKQSNITSREHGKNTTPNYMHVHEQNSETKHIIDTILDMYFSNLNDLLLCKARVVFLISLSNSIILNTFVV